MIYSGIDLHKTNMVITTIDSNGQRLAQRKLACQKRLVRAYFEGYNQPHQAVVESTGSWYWLSDLLSGMGVDLRLAHALQLKGIYTEAAVRAVQWYPVVRAFYNRKTRRSGRRIARAIVAKELAKIVWYMLYFDRSYQGFKGRPTRAKTPQWPRPASP